MFDMEIRFQDEVPQPDQGVICDVIVVMMSMMMMKFLTVIIITTSSYCFATENNSMLNDDVTDGPMKISTYILMTPLAKQKLPKFHQTVYHDTAISQKHEITSERLEAHKQLQLTIIRKSRSRNQMMT